MRTTTARNSPPAIPRPRVVWISPETTFSNGIWLEPPWMEAVTVGREVSLETIDGEPQLVIVPVDEFRRVVEEQVAVANKDVPVASVTPLYPAAWGDQVDIDRKRSGHQVGLGGRGFTGRVALPAESRGQACESARPGRSLDALLA